jgi:hypothetical protein
MENVLGILELVVYIVAILALSAAATWLVIKISPSESAKQQKKSRDADAAS